MSDERDEAIAARARAVLDRSSDELDATTSARLRAARLRALDSLVEPQRHVGRRLAVASAFAVLVVALAVSLWPRTQALDVAQEDELEDVEILSAADDLELYDELDFYRWLDDEHAI